MEPKTFSVQQISVTPLGFEKSLLEFVKADIKACGIEFNYLEEYGVEKGIELVKSLPLEVSHATPIGVFTQETEDEYLAAREKDKERIVIAKKLGTKTVLTVAGPLQNMRLPEAKRQTIRGLRELGDFAAEHGMVLGLEAIHHMYSDSYSFVTTLADALEIVNIVGRDNVGVFVDAYHVWQDPGILDTIKEAKGKIVGCHINDWRPVTRSDSDRTIMGWGCIPLKEFLGAVVQAGWDDWFDVEIFSDELWAMPPQEFLAECKKQYELLWSE